MGKKSKILIIEDDQALLTALRDRFLEENMEVLTAADGEVGLSLALQEKPDIILLDLMMPRMNGLDLLAKLRENECGKDIFVFVMTALDDKEKKERVKKLGAEYLVKSSMNLEDVVRLVKGKLSSLEVNY